MDRAVAIVGQDRAQNSQGYLGYGGHVLTMPVDGGRTMNIVAFKTATTGDWGDEKWVLLARKEMMQVDFSGWSQDVTRLLDAMAGTDLWALFEHPRLKHIRKGNVVLLGDAAHATSPHQGSGAGMAIEDALVLGHVLGLAGCQGEFGKAFASYESTRLERCMKVVETSRECGEIYQFMHAEIDDDPSQVDNNLSNQYNWIWDIDLEAHVRAAERHYSQI